MKKLLFSFFLFTVSTILFAQNPEVTRFMGIPVDGTKTEMIQKLKSKGFVSSQIDPNILTGEFNGQKVNVHIATNNNKVYRIAVADANPVNESEIRIRFNNLCKQFVNNPKYIGTSDHTIPEDEDISYEMDLNNKRYDAYFMQKAEAFISNDIKKNFKHFLDGLGEDTTKNLSEEEVKELFAKHCSEIMQNKIVWFTIHEASYKEYYIMIYYDNEYNKAHGEDL